MKKIITFSLVTLFISLLVHTNIYAKSNNNSQIEYFDDGSYVVITIAEESTYNPYEISLCSSTATKTKTANYYNSSHTLMWYVQVKGTFTYGNGSSKCTKSEVYAESYNSYWKLSNKTSSKSGNKTTASVTAKLYKTTKVMQTINRTVTLTCSPTGQSSLFTIIRKEI